ncbi:hypothetical protein D3C87_1087530 [compost metagenome]
MLSNNSGNSKVALSNLEHIAPTRRQSRIEFVSVPRDQSLQIEHVGLRHLLWLHPALLQAIAKAEEFPIRCIR